jgi:hypothetical protein
MIRMADSSFFNSIAGASKVFAWVRFLGHLASGRTRKRGVRYFSSDGFGSWPPMPAML